MRLIIWALIVLSCGTAMAHDEGYKIDLMQTHLASMRSITSFPQRGADYEFVKLAKVVPETIQSKFDAIQLNVFGQKLITLSFCEEDDSPESAIMQAMLAEAHVCIFENGLLGLLGELQATIDSDLVTNILAHEIAHFVTELSVPSSSLDSRTINGNISIYSQNFEAFVAAQVGVEIQNMSEEQMVNINSFVPAYMQLASQAHAEVDVFGFLIMRQVGLNIPYSMIFRMLALSAASESQADIRERRKAAQFFQRWAYHH